MMTDHTQLKFEVSEIVSMLENKHKELSYGK